MISANAALGVAFVALAMVLTPGPNMIYLTSRTLSQGRRAGLISLAGIALGFLVYLSATNLGLAAAFRVVPALYVSVKLAGAAYLAYLAYLAVRALRSDGGSIFSPTTLAVDSNRRLFGMGLTTSLLNPKIAVMYLSLIPQFESPRAGHLVAQGFTLGAIQILVSLSVNFTIVLAAGAMSRFLARRPTWLRVQRWVMGSVLGVLALALATDHSHPRAVR
jgi:threonine/homoserine/homoserine lactone efflux protein